MTEQTESQRWATEKEAMREFVERREAFLLQERAEANAAVKAALASYRWWGFTNIVNTLRLKVQAFRLWWRRG